MKKVEKEYVGRNKDFLKKKICPRPKFLPTEAKPLTLATTLCPKTHQLNPKVDKRHIG